MLRQLWSVVETSQSQMLLNLDDNSLVQCLLKQLKTQRSLAPEEASAYTHYIHSRLPLIRDVAGSRTMLYS